MITPPSVVLQDNDASFLSGMVAHSAKMLATNPTDFDLRLQYYFCQVCSKQQRPLNGNMMLILCEYAMAGPGDVEGLPEFINGVEFKAAVQRTIAFYQKMRGE